MKKTLMSDLPDFEQIACDYDPDKNEKPLEGYSANSREVVWWKCSCGHQYRASIISRVRGAGCPYDSGKLPIIGVSDLATVAPDLVSEYDQEKNTLEIEKYTPASMRKVWWKCKEGHSYEMTIRRKMRGGVCPICESKQK